MNTAAMFSAGMAKSLHFVFDFNQHLILDLKIFDGMDVSYLPSNSSHL
jgi:hypothetical protein